MERSWKTQWKPPGSMNSLPASTLSRIEECVENTLSTCQEEWPLFYRKGALKSSVFFWCCGCITWTSLFCVLTTPCGWIIPLFQEWKLMSGFFCMQVDECMRGRRKSHPLSQMKSLKVQGISFSLGLCWRPGKNNWKGLPSNWMKREKAGKNTGRKSRSNTVCAEGVATPGRSNNI